MADYRKRIDVEKVTSYLNLAFTKAAIAAYDKIGNKAIRTVNKKTKKVTTTPLYDYQVEFMYLIDNIMRGPQYIVPKAIQKANELIAALEAEQK